LQIYDLGVQFSADGRNLYIAYILNAYLTYLVTMLFCDCAVTNGDMLVYFKLRESAKLVEKMKTNGKQ